MKRLFILFSLYLVCEGVGLLTGLSIVPRFGGWNGTVGVIGFFLGWAIEIEFARAREDSRALDTRAAVYGMMYIIPPLLALVGGIFHPYILVSLLAFLALIMRAAFLLSRRRQHRGERTSNKVA